MAESRYRAAVALIDMFDYWLESVYMGSDDLMPVEDMGMIMAYLKSQDGNQVWEEECELPTCQLKFFVYGDRIFTQAFPTSDAFKLTDLSKLLYRRYPGINISIVSIPGGE